DAQTDLQHTLEEESPWWQVDLGSLHTLGVLDVYNRSENFAYRLRNFYVLVSPTPFPDGSGLGDLLSDGEVESYYFSGQAGPQESIPLNTEGRYVRIQLSGTGILHMAEVEIAGCTTSSPNTSFKASFERLDYLSGNREFDTVGLAPNPTSDKVQVVGPSKNTVSKILIYDMQGRQVKEITNIRGDSQRVVESVDVSNLVKATYVVIVFLEDGSSYSRRLIKI
ncbi:galactose-binding domain-containing protein, partial [Pseudozobellia thermophila]